MAGCFEVLKVLGQHWAFLGVVVLDSVDVHECYHFVLLEASMGSVNIQLVSS